MVKRNNFVYRYNKQKHLLFIFNSLKNDRTLLWENYVKRFFGVWNMAFHNPDDNDIKTFVENLIFYSELTEKSSGSLLSFWATVRRMLSTGKIGYLENIDLA